MGKLAFADARRADSRSATFIGMITGIIANGKVTKKSVLVLDKWIEGNPIDDPHWRIDELIALIGDTAQVIEDKDPELPSHLNDLEEMITASVRSDLDADKLVYAWQLEDEEDGLEWGPGPTAQPSKKPSGCTPWLAGAGWILAILYALHMFGCLRPIPSPSRLLVARTNAAS